MSVFTVAREGLPVPPTALPENTEYQLPHLTSTDLSFLKTNGWARVGVAAAIAVESSQHQYRLLMLEHRASDKSPDRAWGPLAETAQVSRTGSVITPESSAHTLARALREELGVNNPAQLGLVARQTGAWVVNNWAVGVNYPDQVALAICPITYLNSERAAELERSFEPTEEIAAIRFMTPGKVMQQPVLRPSTAAWLRDVHVGLTTHALAEHVPLELPDPTPLPGAEDVKLASLAYL